MLNLLDFFFILLICTLQKIRLLIELQTYGSNYPQKIYCNNENWIKRPGDLSAAGIRQMYMIGRDFKDKFMDNNNNSLISPFYNGFESYTRAYYYNSSEYIRSAYAKLAGIYFTGYGPTINMSLVNNSRPPIKNWDGYMNVESELRDAALLRYYQAATVDSQSFGPDYMLGSYFECPRIKFLITNSTENDGPTAFHIRNFEKDYQDLYKNLSVCFDKSSSYWNIMNVAPLYKYFQSINIEFFNDYCFSSLNLKKFKELSDYYYLNITFQNPIISKLITSELYLFIIETLSNMKLVDNSSTPDNQKLKYVLLVLDPIIIRALFKQICNCPPSDDLPFGSLFQIQIDQDTNYSVSLIYNGNEVKLNNKTSNSLEFFVSFLQNYTMSNISKICNEVPPPFDYDFYLKISYYFEGVMILIMVSGWVFGICAFKPKVLKESEGLGMDAIINLSHENNSQSLLLKEKDSSSLLNLNLNEKNDNNKNENDEFIKEEKKHFNILERKNPGDVIFQHDENENLNPENQSNLMSLDLSKSEIKQEKNEVSAAEENQRRINDSNYSKQNDESIL